MKPRLPIPVATTVFCSLLLLILPEHGRCETLREAVAAALAVNPEVLGAQARVGAARGQLDQARAGFRPTLDLRAGKGEEQTDNITTRAQGYGYRSLERNEVSLTLRQMLYDGKQVSNDVQRGASTVDSQIARQDDARENAAQGAVNAYIEVLRAQALLTLTDSLVAAHADVVAKTAWRLERGVGTYADAKLAEGRLASASSTLVSQRSRLALAGAGYQRAVEHPPGRLDPVTPPGKMPASERQAQDEALAQNPGCLAADADVAAAQAAVNAAQGRYLPQLDLELGANRTDNVNGLSGQNNSQSAMLQFHYNLYRGGSDTARMYEFAEQLNAAKENRHKTHVAIKEAVSRAWIEMGAARERLASLELHLTSSRAVLEAYRAQYEVGKRTLLDTLNAESELYQAETDLASGRYDLLIAQFRLLGAMGVLVRSFGLSEENKR